MWKNVSSSGTFHAIVTFQIHAYILFCQLADHLQQTPPNICINTKRMAISWKVACLQETILPNPQHFGTYSIPKLWGIWWEDFSVLCGSTYPHFWPFTIQVLSLLSLIQSVLLIPLDMWATLRYECSRICKSAMGPGQDYREINFYLVGVAWTCLYVFSDSLHFLKLFLNWFCVFEIDCGISCTLEQININSTQAISGIKNRPAWLSGTASHSYPLIRNEKILGSIPRVGI